MAWTLTELYELLGRPLRGLPQPPRFLLLYAIAVSNSCAVVGGSGCVSWRIDSALK